MLSISFVAQNNLWNGNVFNTKINIKFACSNITFDLPICDTAFLSRNILARTQTDMEEFWLYVNLFDNATCVVRIQGNGLSTKIASGRVFCISI